MEFRSRSKLKIAIVHDALVVPAGSERVALSISNLFPDAPIFTSAYLPENTFPEFKTKDIHTLQFSNLIKNERQFKKLYPLWLAELQLLNFSKFDLVISSANYLSKFVHLPKHTIHVCYLYNPIRFLWKHKVYSKESLPFGSISLSLIKSFLPVLQKYDIKRTRKIDHLLTISNNVAGQIDRIYGRTAEVIYPPVDISSYPISSISGDYYLYAGRLISHKRADIAINACKKLNRRLIVAGDGLEREKLEELAGKNVVFTGRVTDQELKELYANCRALLFPSDEDFGLVPVEAQACGRPIIAFRSGGALETVIAGETGVFFDAQTTESLIEAIQRFELLSFDSDRIRRNAMNFDISVFNNKFRSFIDQVISHEGAKIEKQS